MIQYLRYNQIDKGRWDDCIGKAVNNRVYAFSWYLDIVSPGWEGLVSEDYSAVFPLTHRRKLGVRYLCQPFFAQQLGLFSRTHLTAGLVEAFLDAIPEKYRFTEIHLNALNKIDPTRFDAEFRLNHELDLIGEYPALVRGFSQNTRRNIRKSMDMGVQIGRKVDKDELITLFRDNFGTKEGKLRFKDYEVMRDLIHYCINQNLGYLLGAYTCDGKLTASAFFLKSGSRVYFLFAASSPEARKNGGMFLIIDRFIHEHAGQAITLDFEGGNDPDLGRFYKSFGAIESPYSLLRINHLPWFLDKGVNFARKLKQ